MEKVKLNNSLRMYILGLLFSILLIDGCAFVSRDVNIDIVGQRIAFPREKLTGKLHVRFSPILDSRPEKNRLGVARNKLMMVTANVGTTGDLSGLFENIVRQNFAASGIIEGKSKLTIKTEILEAFTDASGPDHIYVRLKLGLAIINSTSNDTIYYQIIKGFKETPVTQISNLAWEDAFVGASNQISEQIYQLASQIRLSLKNPQSSATPSTKIVSSGTCFAISGDGQLVTSYHVIKKSKSIKVKLYGRSFEEAKIIKSSPANDLAVLKIQSKTPDFLQLVSAKTVSLGTPVFTMGFPVTSILGSDVKFSEGVINSMSGFQNDASYIQISTPVHPGNSGGPIVTDDGSVVGVVASTAAVANFIEKTGTLPQSVNWGVKADYLIPMIDNLKTPNKQANNRQEAIELVRKALCFINVE